MRTLSGSPTPGAGRDRPPAVETTGLTKRFGDVEAVRGVDLQVPAGAVFGFLGPNGAGKTTTISMLVGLLRPTAGRARILGLDATDDPLALRGRVGFLPQQPVFYDDMTARETLRYVGGFFDFDHRALEQRIDEVLGIVGMRERADRSVAGFSGGERQRLGLAQAQLHDPELLILDEPAAGLDPLGRRDVLLLLERLRDRCTVVYSTHILDDVQRVSDTVAIIRDGVIIAQGSMDSMVGGATPTYRVELTGRSAALHDRLLAQPWVSTIDASATGASGTGASGTDGGQRWRIDVSDEQAADRDLLRAIVADPAVTVTAFGRHRDELEEVFVHLVEQEQPA